MFEEKLLDCQWLGGQIVWEGMEGDKAEKRAMMCTGLLNGEI